MKILGDRLEATCTLLPMGGIVSCLLPLLGLLGVMALFAGGMPNIENAIVAIGMFSMGVLHARSLPIWREARPGEIERIEERQLRSPLAPWIRLTKQRGLLVAIGCILSLCAAFILLSKLFLIPR